ncbi:coagulation factor 5/8 type [Planotetraspora silvatica]|uniref:Coagulation factor 5/8 type n=1 Tax=Planotetraspora silvatica TaxID=234614 RepID=A0A8J3XSZ1_9ACTN|nr:alpha-(1->3)-arabinofuranosyltransferase family protein [Planotetraspora silvatica]GII51006.1 coagulation factor 5/8 type [Planotetraspora silvatica]
MTVANWIGQLAPAEADSYGERFRHRLRLVAGCLLLGAIAFNTATEKIIAETKLDMAVDPLRFLGRALHLWDNDYFGHLQNQAYGYLFPMGPFYALWLKLDMPAWNVQRLWMSFVLCAAFLGVVQLARALRVGTPNTRILAGLAYALAPHAQALIGINSSEFLPSAMMPWIMLPLVRGAQGTTGPRRAAALSALAFLLCGGVNATAEIAVLIAPAVYLLTRSRGPLRRRLTAWWCVMIAAVSFWWAVPLLVLGRYVFSFLPFIENATATTGVTSLTNVLRGTSSWLAFLSVDGQPWMAGAYQQAFSPWLIVVTVLLAGLGLAGLALRSLPERAFLIITLLVGVAIVAAGHASAIAGPLNDAVVQTLDGPLAVFRNLHKFDALIRLPVVLGLAGLLALVKPPARLPLAAAGVAMVAATCVPIVAEGLAPSGSFTEIPGYWKQATTWLDENAGDQMVLAVPGSKRGEYQWGRPLDEPMQPLLTARWATHTIVPWGSAGSSRLLAAIDDRFASGQGSAGLTDTLRRIGVGYLVVRNDLDRRTIGTAWPARVHQAIEDSPGITLVKQFGPGVGDAHGSIASGWLDQPYSALEIYRVGDAAPLVGTVPVKGALRVGGAPEAVLDLAEQGLLPDDRPVVLGDDPGASAIPAYDTVVTDTLRKTDVQLSDLREVSGATLTPGETTSGPDLTDPAWEPFQSTARYLEIAGVRASSSEADATAIPGSRDPGRQPFAALDGDRRTGWRSAGWNGPLGEWLEVTLTKATDIPYVTLALDQSYIGPPPSEVAVETDAGTRRQAVTATAEPQRLALPPGPTTRVRIRITKLAYEPKMKLGSRVGITELTIPGVTPGRTIVVPQAPGDPRGEAVVSFSRNGDVPACMRGSYVWACSTGLAVQGEDAYGFNRAYVSQGSGERTLSGQAVLTDRSEIERVTSLPGEPLAVTSSSTYTGDPATIARSAFDGNPRTVWYADPLDRTPTLDVKLARPVTLSRVKVEFPDSSLGPPPVRLTLRGDGGTREGWVGRDGWIEFPPMKTGKLSITFTASSSRPIEVNDVTIPGVRPLGALTGYPLRLPCGFGPTPSVDGAPVHTKIVGGTLADVLAGRPLTYEACEPFNVLAGETRLSASPQDPYRIRTAVIRRPGAEAAPPTVTRPVDVQEWTGWERRVEVGATAASYLVVNENFNDGWHASVAGRELTPARLDGWRQAWILPAGTNGTVTMSYQPDGVYRAGLAVGVALVLLVVAAAVVPARRRAVHPVIGPRGMRVKWLWPFVPVYGFWIGGVTGLAVLTALFAATVLFRRVSAGEHARRGTAVVAVSRALSSAPAALASLALAGLSLAAGTALLSTENTAWGRPLSDLVPQLLCLPLIARLFANVPDDPSRAPAPRTADPGGEAPQASPPARRDAHLSGVP